MPTRIQIALKNGRNSKYDLISGEFTDEESEILEHFLEQGKELLESKPLREGIPCNFSIQSNESEALKCSATLPSKDDLSILLHRLRPFILQSEPTSFSNVCGIIGKRIRNKNIRDLLKEERRFYDGRYGQKRMQFLANKKIVNSEEVLLDWLNSHEYHQDWGKREVIDSLFAIFPPDMVKGIFVSMLIDKTRSIINMAALVSVLLGKQRELSFSLPNRDKMTIINDNP